MKLVSINTEKDKHLPVTLPFLERENPDIICAMEATTKLEQWLQNRGYQVTYSLSCYVHDADQILSSGSLLASKIPHQAETYYYHGSQTNITTYDTDRKDETTARPVIFAEVGSMHIATTHFTWAQNGEHASPEQRRDLGALLTFLSTKPAHVLCGDLNIPRFLNELYDTLTEEYTDEIPLAYESSLDVAFHRAATNPALKKLFRGFMVDYVLTQKPYYAQNTRLQFDVSDHAAIVTTLKKV